MKPISPHNKFIASVLLSGGLASVGLFGGLGIQAVRDQLLSFTPLLIALPAMNAMAGDYATLIAAHVGDPEVYSQRIRKLLLSLVVSLPVSIIGVTGVSLFIAWLQGFMFTKETVVEYVVLISISLIAILLFTLLSVFAINQLLKNKQLNSDDVLIPVTNTIATLATFVSFTIIALRLQ